MEKRNSARVGALSLLLLYGAQCIANQPIDTVPTYPLNPSYVPSAVVSASTIEKSANIDLITAQAQHQQKMRELMHREKHIKAMLIEDRIKREQLANIQFSGAGGLMLFLLGYLFVEHRKRERMKRLALTDPLTGTYNRRAILSKAKKAVCDMKSKTVSIAILDLDHFKSINDTYGHDVGDEVLSTFVKTCKPLLRGSDRLGRYGGEEFLMILPDARQEDVQKIFQRLQQAMLGLSYQTAEGMVQIDVTISMGAVVSKTHPYKDNVARETQLGKLIKSADELVYQAKHSGRNQLCCA